MFALTYVLYARTYVVCIMVYIQYECTNYTHTYAYSYILMHTVHSNTTSMLNLGRKCYSTSN